MRICIDARNLISLERMGGTGEYLQNLLINLAKIDVENEYILFLNYIRGRHRTAVKDYVGKNFHERVCRIPWQFVRSLFEKIHLPIELLTGRVDIFHGTDFMIPRQLFGKSVVAIHDLMYLNYPEFLEPEWVESYKRNVKWSLTRSDLIIVASNFVKGDILKNFNMSKDKIRVIYNGISDHFMVLKEQPRAYITKKYGIKYPYILFVGTLEPKKNLVRLVEAFYQLLRSKPKRLNLVLAGGEGCLNYRDKIEQKVKELNLKEEVIFTGYIQDEDLPKLYNCAEIFVFPSIFEGFGIPPLEAMASGLPVIASDAASLPEIAGDAGILVDPFDTKAITEAISSCLSNDQLRKTLIRKGLARAGLFSWEATARQTLALYKELGERG